jgi:hypothetical protein
MIVSVAFGFKDNDRVALAGYKTNILTKVMSGVFAEEERRR